MYKVKMKTLMMGPNIRVMPGEIIDVDDDLGRHLIKSGSAELINITQKEIETTMFQAPENAMLPKPKGRKPR